MNSVGPAPDPHPSDAETTVAVTVVVPCRNEREHIEACVRSILEQADVPGGFEVIVVDGMSEDGTRDILRSLADEDSALTVLDNPQRITPVAMNIGVDRARGAHIAILGAHAIYDPHYLATCLRLMTDHPEAAVVGGPIRSRGQTSFGRAVARAMSHPLGIGNARHRHPDYEGYAEGACFPMFRRGIFQRYGRFDETLIRNQDDEFYLRLARAGERTYISPRAASDYFVRETPGGLFRQYFQYGRWRAEVMKRLGRPASLRQVIPTLFYLAVVGLLILGLILGGEWWWMSVALPVVYVTCLSGAGAAVSFRDGLKIGALFVMAVSILHAAYASGLARGVASQLWGRK